MARHQSLDLSLLASVILLPLHVRVLPLVSVRYKKGIKLKIEERAPSKWNIAKYLCGLETRISRDEGLIPRSLHRLCVCPLLSHKSLSSLHVWVLPYPCASAPWCVLSLHMCCSQSWFQPTIHRKKKYIMVSTRLAGGNNTKKGKQKNLHAPYFPALGGTYWKNVPK